MYDNGIRQHYYYFLHSDTDSRSNMRSITLKRGQEWLSVNNFSFPVSSFRKVNSVCCILAKPCSVNMFRWLLQPKAHALSESLCSLLKHGICVVWVCVRGHLSTWECANGPGVCRTVHTRALSFSFCHWTHKQLHRQHASGNSLGHRQVGVLKTAQIRTNRQNFWLPM